MKTFILHIRPLKSDVPEYVRLRHVLKRLLRTYEFRCVDMQEIPCNQPVAVATSADPSSQVTTFPIRDPAGTAGSRAGPSRMSHKPRRSSSASVRATNKPAPRRIDRRSGRGVIRRKAG